MYELPVVRAAVAAAVAAAAPATCQGRASVQDLVTSSFSTAPMVPPGARAAGPAAPAWWEGGRGDDEGPALQLLSQPPLGPRPPAAAIAARIGRAFGFAAEGGRGRSGPRAADPATPAPRPHRGPVSRPRSGRSRRAAGRWGRQWQ